MKILQLLRKNCCLTVVMTHCTTKFSSFPFLSSHLVQKCIFTSVLVAEIKTVVNGAKWNIPWFQLPIEHDDVRFLARMAQQSSHYYWFSVRFVRRFSTKRYNIANEWAWISDLRFDFTGPRTMHCRIFWVKLMLGSSSETAAVRLVNSADNAVFESVIWRGSFWVNVGKVLSLCKLLLLDRVEDSEEAWEIVMSVLHCHYLAEQELLQRFLAEALLQEY